MSALPTPDIRILCIGSPQAPDDLAWQVAQALVGRFDPSQVEVHMLDRPGARLIEFLRNTHTVILVDAVRSDVAVGTLHRYAGQDIAGLLSQTCSSHGWGLADSLALARQLGEWPEQIAFIGLEVGTTPAKLEEVNALTQAVFDTAEQALAALNYTTFTS